MSGMILCRSEYSKVPYYIEGADINVYSIEEISYFLYHDIYLVGADFFCEELFAFIEKNIKEPELADRLRRLKARGAELSESVLTVLGYVDFYSEDEIAGISSLLDRLDTQNPLERMKARADSYLQNRRYIRAISGYEGILNGRKDASLGDVFYGNLWHNMGTAYAALFNFESAEDCFERAAELNQSEISKECAGKAAQMAGMHRGTAVELTDISLDVHSGGVEEMARRWKEEYLGYIR